MRIIFLLLLCAIAFASPSNANWTGAKAVGISGFTDWGAVTTDASGNFYFGGVSDLLGGTPGRGFVMAKHNDSLGRTWATKLIGGSAAYAGETAVGVDAAGNMSSPRTPIFKCWPMSRCAITRITL